MAVANVGRLVAIGRVAGAFGLRGWIRVQSYTQPRQGLARRNPWLIGEAPDAACSYEVQQVRWHGARLIAKLKGVDDRDMARDLYGSDIQAYEEAPEKFAGDEHYWSELIGLEVLDSAGGSFGRVHSLMETGANDVLVVVDGARRRLIPYIKDRFVKNVDTAAGLMQVDWDADW